MELRLAHIKAAALAHGIRESDFDNWAHSFALAAHTIGYDKGFDDGVYETWKTQYL